MTDKPKSHGNQGHPDPDKAGRDQYKRHVDGDITVRGQIETHIPPSAAQQHTTERTEDKRTEKKKFIVEVVTLVVVIIYAGLTAWQGCSNKKSADAAKTSADVAHDSLVLSNRPWVSAEVYLTSPLQFSDAGASITLDVRLQNVGHSVAKSVGAWPALTFDRINALTKQQELCDKANAPINAKSDFGYLLFPDQPAIRVPTAASASKEDIANAVAKSPGGSITPYLLVCVDYQSTVEGQHRQTKLIRMLVKPRPEINAIIGAFNPQEGPVSDVKAIPAGRGDSAN
jgi:hypothetical protein